MEYKVIAMDLDGTLNNDEKVITPRTREALMQAQEQGVRLVLASARPTPGLYKESRILELDKFGGILMAYNGGRICAADTGETLFETCMPRELASRVLRHLEGFPVTPILDDGRQFYVQDKHGYMVDYECRNNQMTCTEVENLADFISFSPIKILMSGREEELPGLIGEIEAPFEDKLHVVMTAPFYLEVIPRNIHKGQGLAEVCRLLDVMPSQVIAFGDAQNDIPMIQRAGLGVAMGNACKELKEAADRVTGSNNEDGIAQVLEELWRMA
ncbi:MAG: HAD family phosphatase [Lachnospiraceae bacterium]|jgi:Cof subfamily protein (haloacid dehalogenase superfamily)|nr:HAD family phosphatase [Lachnospiraceae bacterium]